MAFSKKSRLDTPEPAANSAISLRRAKAAGPNGCVINTMVLQLHGSQQASMIASVAATWSDYATCAPNKMIGDGILNTYVALLQVCSW